jgi:hypothetical protein
MENIEDNKDNVEMMTIVEELEKLSPYASQTGRPHHQSSKQSYFSSHIGNHELVPFEHLPHSAQTWPIASVASTKPTHSD